RQADRERCRVRVVDVLMYLPDITDTGGALAREPESLFGNQDDALMHWQVERRREVDPARSFPDDFLAHVRSEVGWHIVQWCDQLPVEDARLVVVEDRAGVGEGAPHHP